MDAGYNSKHPDDPVTSSGGPRPAPPIRDEVIGFDQLLESDVGSRLLHFASITFASITVSITFPIIKTHQTNHIIYQNN